MKPEIKKTSSEHVSPFERIRRTNDAGVEYWSSRDFSQVLQYNLTHRQVGAKVRQTIKELGGTMPEDLRSADSIKKLQSKKPRELK